MEATPQDAAATAKPSSQATPTCGAAWSSPGLDRRKRWARRSVCSATVPRSCQQGPPLERPSARPPTARPAHGRPRPPARHPSRWTGESPKSGKSPERESPEISHRDGRPGIGVGTALRRRRCYTGAARAPYWHDTGSTLYQNEWYCTGAILVLDQCCACAALALHWHGTGAPSSALVLHKDCAGTALPPRWRCTDTVRVLRWHRACATYLLYWLRTGATQVPHWHYTCTWCCTWRCAGVVLALHCYCTATITGTTLALH